MAAQEKHDITNKTYINYDKNDKNYYLNLCKKHNLQCEVEYDFEQKKTAAVEKKQPTLNSQHLGTSGNVNGTLQIIIIAVIIVVAIFLWFYFGNGGVLLSSQPTQKKKSKVPLQEKPENWQTADMTKTHHIDDFINQLKNTQDRTKALIILLRHCLIFAADMSDTHLARSDTERTVLRRLPKDVLNRADLENLLYITELAHYGGQNIEEEDFRKLLIKGKQFLKQEMTSHA